jgi:hypothetical protein
VPDASSLLPLGHAGLAGSDGGRRRVERKGANAMSDRVDPAATAPLAMAACQPAVQPAMLGVLGVLAGLAALLSRGVKRNHVCPQRRQRRLLRRGHPTGMAHGAGWRARTHRRSTGDPHDRDDPAPTVLSDPDGHDPRAERRVAGAGDTPVTGHVAHAFAALLPNASSVVARQTAVLRDRDSAEETVTTPRGPGAPVRPHGGWHPVASGRYAASRPAGEGIGLPMMTVSHADTILFGQCRHAGLLGADAQRWRRCFPISRSCPVGARGCARARRWSRWCRSSCRRDGRREIYAVPDLADPPAASVAARAFEMLPVASLHIGAGRAGAGLQPAGADASGDRAP